MKILKNSPARLILGLAFLTSLALVVVAQTASQPKNDQGPESPDIQISGPSDNSEIPAIAPSSHWIGIRVSPVPDVLLSHFGVKNDPQEKETGLVVVEQIVPDGPAVKAGVQRGDIILEFGGQEIHSLIDLVEKVRDAKETEQSMTVIRDGKQQTLTITPEVRPNEPFGLSGAFPMEHPALRNMPMFKQPGMKLGPEVWVGPRDPQKMMREMEEHFRQMQDGADDEEPLILPEEKDIADTGLGTGAAVRSTAKQIEVSTKTEADGSTKIHVKQVLKNGSDTEEKTWEVGSVDELPEEIQKEVQVVFGR